MKFERTATRPGDVPAAAFARTKSDPDSPADELHTDAAHSGTRHRVARSILENGPSTAAALAERLGLTPAAVRRHLDALLAEEIIEARDPVDRGHRGRGRPARLYALTDTGRDSFDQAYDDLAASAMRFLREQAGETAVAEFARKRVGELEERYRPDVAAAASGARARVLADALTRDGYAAATRSAPGGRGIQLCQHHCPVAHVAGEFPELCEAETEAFARLLGTHVQRLATIAHGDGVCTTYIPAVSFASKSFASKSTPVSDSVSERTLR